MNKRCDSCGELITEGRYAYNGDTLPVHEACWALEQETDTAMDALHAWPRSDRDLPPRPAPWGTPMTPATPAYEPPSA